MTKWNCLLKGKCVQGRVLQSLGIWKGSQEGEGTSEWQWHSGPGKDVLQVGGSRSAGATGARQTDKLGYSVTVKQDHISVTTCSKM